MITSISVSDPDEPDEWNSEERKRIMPCGDHLENWFNPQEMGVVGYVDLDPIRDKLFLFNEEENTFTIRDDSGLPCAMTLGLSGQGQPEDFLYAVACELLRDKPDIGQWTAFHDSRHIFILMDSQKNITKLCFIMEAHMQDYGIAWNVT